MQYLPDQNGEFADGYFPITHSNASEQRVSAAMGYLDRETRERPILTISTHTQVKELLFDGTRCVGVKAVVSGAEQEFRGNEVVLSCGAIHSPAHLLRAGIGPVGHLHDMGIPVLMGLAGVGQRLMDHPSISLSSFCAARRAHERAHAAPHPDGIPLFLGASRRAQGRHVRRRHDQISLAFGRRADRLAFAFVNKTYSETGQVKLASRDFRAEPTVEFNLLSDRRDLDRLMSGFPQDGGPARGARR